MDHERWPSSSQREGQKMWAAARVQVGFRRLLVTEMLRPGPLAGFPQGEYLSL